jgi:hypothetical protein
MLATWLIVQAFDIVACIGGASEQDSQRPEGLRTGRQNRTRARARGDRPINRVAELTPSAWAAHN